MDVIIEPKAGFCFGVVSAIKMVEKELGESSRLYCIGDIVHNNKEVERLADMGLDVIGLSELDKLRDTKVMIRAHGEPPSTYNKAKENGIEIIDATCPIVLKLQKDVREGYKSMKKVGGQVLIYGKKGHAEVVGLVGQTENKAIVISSDNDFNLIDFSKPIHIFSQTTMSKDGYEQICKSIKNQMCDEVKMSYIVTDSICRKVSSRSKELLEFANSVDVVLFVSGRHSSNGMYLYNLCKEHKENTYLVTEMEDINFLWFKDCQTVGISGATSTPMWLMEQIKEYVSK